MTTLRREFAYTANGSFNEQKIAIGKNKKIKKAIFEYKAGLAGDTNYVAFSLSTQTNASANNPDSPGVLCYVNHGFQVVTSGGMFQRSREELNLEYLEVSKFEYIYAQFQNEAGGAGTAAVVLVFVPENSNEAK